MEAQITQDMILARLVYLKEAGHFVWLRRPLEEFESKNKWSVWNNRYVGSVAGTVGTLGYRSINIFGKMRRSSRVTWMYHYGYWPEVVDHIDGDTLHDRIENLRDVSHTINCQNRSMTSTNKTGVLGVYRGGDKYRAQISAFGRKHYLGSFDTLAEAAAARKEAEAKFGFHPNHGRAA